ncbi:MAG: transglutaminase family protein [Alsobacter sp.]
MLYAIRHRTTYHYAARAAGARLLLHLQPAERPGQQVLASGLDVSPGPAERAEFADFFGNRTTAMRFADLPSRLVIDATATVRVSPPAGPAAAATPAWEEVREAALRARDLSGSSPVHMLFPSRFAPLLPEAAAYGEPCLGLGRPVLEAAEALMRRIHADFAYDPEATDISTPIDEVLRLRRGVCQDFAHLMIGALRGHGLPAAYVSGYLRTRPPPGRERLVGADATHAWVAVWCGEEAGWIGLDPTNAAVAGEDHVVLAIGRDYGDIAPVAGVVTLSADHRVEVEVDVMPMDEPVPPLLRAGHGG